MDINKFFNLAKHASMFSDFGDDKKSKHMGCVFVYKNKVLSVGWNQKKEHTLQKRYNIYRDFNVEKNPNSIHAEICAMSKISNTSNIDWKKVHVFVYREFADGSPAMARPCNACMNAICDIGILKKNIYYSTDYGFGKEI